MSPPHTQSPDKKRVLPFLLSPPRLIIGSFVFAIFTGWLLLSLPFSATKGHPLPLIDALFTATSGVCVTGLTVITVEKDLSFWGQVFLLILIQLGGLGIMTFSTFFLYFLRRSPLTYSGREALHQTLTPRGVFNIYRLLFAIFKLTFLIELLGTGALFLCWYRPSEGSQWSKVLWDSAFHSVSAFCNAGFSTFGENLFRYRNNLPSIVIIAILIILGGFGFIVLAELFYPRSSWLQRRHSFTISLQSRIVFLVSFLLIVAGAVVFLALDFNSSLKDIPLPRRVIHSFFQSITARTAGFNTVDFGAVSNLSLLVLMLLMFVGGSPGSTAGGIKTTTLAVIIATIFSHIRNRDDVEMLRRRVPHLTVSRAFVILVLGLMTVTTFFIALSLAGNVLISSGGHQAQDPAIRLLFETVSAFGTVGLSTGITPYFNTAGKLLLVILMLIGRLGPLTVAVAIVEGREKLHYRYPEEEIMVG